jgi:hypothetical protein
MKLLVSGSTRTIRGLADNWPDHLGHLMTPNVGNRVETMLKSGLPWAADNGAFSGFDAERFTAFLGRIGFKPRCLFVAVPDVVFDFQNTLRMFAEWAPIVRSITGQPVAFVGQDGAESAVLPWAGMDVWFVGGSTEWKLSQASIDLMREAKERDKWVHVGRVNSLSRLTWAYDHGADSVDGSSMSKYGDKYIHRFCRWLRGLEVQPRLIG